LDKQRDLIVAIKVVRKVEKYTESAKIEAAILEDVNEKDENHESLCVRMYKWFEYKGHVCMVFERLGCSLYEYLKSHDYKPFPLSSIRAYAWQLLTALDFIHGIKLIHTDLKPENILLVDDEEERSNSALSSPSSSVVSLSSPFASPARRRYRGRGGGRDDSVARERTLSLSFSQTTLDNIDGPHRETLRPPACNAVKCEFFFSLTSFW
jgi:serine/threonine protein kinase